MPTLADAARETGRPKQRRWDAFFADIRQQLGVPDKPKAPAIPKVSKEIEKVARYLIRGFHDHQMGTDIYIEPGFRRLVGNPLHSDPITVCYVHLRKDRHDDFHRALVAWHQACDFEFESVDDPRVADIVVDDEKKGAYAERSFAYAGRRENGRPVFHVEAREININKEWPDWSQEGTMIHEMGHCLGLGHPGPYNGKGWQDKKVFKADTSKNTVMSYFGPNHGVGTADKVAVQMLYG